MRLYPVAHSQIDKVKPLFAQAHSEMITQPRNTLEQALRSLEQGYENRTVAVYVDNLDSPKHCVALALVPGFMVEGLMVVVLLIYSIPEERGLKEVLDSQHMTIDNYAKIHGASTIIGSSWEYKGSRGIAAMWKSRGYEKQEVTYVKLL
jgi:hypothetical protein